MLNDLDSLLEMYITDELMEEASKSLPAIRLRSSNSSLRLPDAKRHMVRALLYILTGVLLSFANKNKSRASCKKN